MVDSLLGDINRVVGGTLNSTVKDALSEDALKALNEQLPSIMAPLMQSFAESGTTITSELSPFLHGAFPDVVDATPDQGADATHVASPQLEIDASALDSLTSRMDSLLQAATTKAGSDDQATAAQGQLELQQIQQLTESIVKVMQQNADDAKPAIDGLRGDVDVHDGTVVAVADTGDAHTTVHVEADTSYDHASDHPVDHTEPTPVHVDPTPADPEGVA
jgi:hypothetical protein